MYHYKKDGVFPWQCNYCDKSTKTHDHMREHAQIHVENLEFDCYKCGKIFHRTNTLRGHRRSKCFKTQLDSSDAGSSDKYGCKYSTIFPQALIQILSNSYSRLGLEFDCIFAMEE